MSRTTALSCQLLSQEQSPRHAPFSFAQEGECAYRSSHDKTTPIAVGERYTTVYLALRGNIQEDQERPSASPDCTCHGRELELLEQHPVEQLEQGSQQGSLTICIHC